MKVFAFWTRFTRPRCRPVALIMMSLVFWVVVFLFYSHNSANSSADINVSRYQIALSNEQQIKETGSLQSDLAPSGGDTKSLTETRDKGQNSDDFGEKEGEFDERRALYERGCKAGFSGPTAPVYYYKPSKLAVCLVQKVGCTFWKQVFFYLYNETEKGQAVSSPFDIDRFYVHFIGGKRVKSTEYSIRKSMVDAFSKVLFVRDPWARLWSGYIDKFVLPDSWLNHGHSIVSRRKDRAKRKFCADDIEFVEFLDYAINNNRDVHWKPVHKVCSPCTFHPHYLGKLETFSSDTKHILRKVGLGRLVEGHDHAHHAENEVRMLTKYHFRIFETRPRLKQCLTHSGVARRLWRAFVLNGYIDPETEFPTSEFVEALDNMKDTREAGVKATELLVRYHQESPPLSSKEMRDYRRSVMAEHYREAPLQLLNKMVDVFNGDFILFDYKARPADIFENKQ